MKANYSRPISKAMHNRVRTEVGKEIERQTKDLSRRLFKLFCIALNQEYGFGKDRLLKVIKTVNDLSSYRETDEVFWSHVDERVKQLGLQFQTEDYQQMDR